jgi:hypothetical protein
MKRMTALLAAACLLAACAREPETLQDTYASMQDCVRDWGAPDLCIARPDKSAPRAPDGKPMSSARSLHFYGPRYVAEERSKLVVSEEGASRRLATIKGGKTGKLVRAESRDK